MHRHQQPQQQQQQRQRHQQQQPHQPLKPLGNDWFGGAPASQLLLALGVALYFVAHDQRAAWQLDGGGGNSTDTYRYMTSKLAFLTTAELIVGTSLQFYLYRRYERELGTRRFMVFWLFVHLFCILQEFLGIQMLTLRNSRMRQLLEASFTAEEATLGSIMIWQYAGPYAFVGALFAMFHWHAPRLHPRFVTAFGFYFSEKTFYYLWFLYLSGSGGWKTLASAATGAVSTTVYLRMRFQDRLDMPDVLVNVVRPLCERVGLVPIAPMIRPIGTAPRQPVQQPPVEQQPLIPMPELDPDAVEQLTAMGFPQSEVMNALRQTHNNVEHAANRLLSGA